MYIPFISYWILHYKINTQSVSVHKTDILNYCLQHNFKAEWTVLTDDPVLLISQKCISKNIYTY